MRTVNYSRYYLPPSPGSGPRAKPYPSGWEMSPEQAAERGLTDADIVPGTTVARQEFDPDEGPPHNAVRRHGRREGWMMEFPSTRESNVRDMLMAGPYSYRDFEGAPPVDVVVAWEHGTCLVRFSPLDGDEGAEVMLTDMAACENWRAHFRRISR